MSMPTTDESAPPRHVSALPPEAWRPLFQLARLAGRPLDRFLRIEAASGISLLVAAAAALIWANSPWAEAYHHLWQTPLGIRVGSFSVERTLATTHLAPDERASLIARLEHGWTTSDEQRVLSALQR